MINGLGVLGWGVGGIEAEAAMLGQPISMLIPEVVGFKLTGKLPEGATATDLVLTVTQMLRKKGVVGKFVEFYGDGLDAPAAGRPRHDRQHGARIRRHLRLLPDRRARPLRYLRFTGREPRPGRAGRGLCQGAGPVAQRRRAPSRSSPTRLELDLGTRRAEPGRPQAAAGPRAAVGRRQRLRQGRLPTHRGEHNGGRDRRHGAEGGSPVGNGEPARQAVEGTDSSSTTAPW